MNPASALEVCRRTENENLVLTFVGKPTNEEFAMESRQHEMDHVFDHIRVFRDVLGFWDIAMQLMVNMGRTFIGRNSADAENQLFRYIGGTPEQIAERFYAQSSIANDNLHQYRSPLMQWGNFTANEDCSTLSVDLWHDSVS